MTRDARDLTEDESPDDLDLPPLDADEGDEPAEGDAHDLPSEAPVGGLDDANASDLDVGAELDDIEDAADDEREDEVDVGPLDEGIDVADEGPAGVGEDEGEADSEGIAIDEEDEGDDGGAEGTGESPEDEVDEHALPEMDDGEEDFTEETALAETLLVENDPAPPPWARARLSPLEGAGAAVPCRSLAVAAGRVAAAGEVLLFVEEGARAARRLPLAEGVVAVALAVDAILASTSRGHLFAVRDDAAEAVSLGAVRGAPTTLAATPGRLWIHAGGSLASATLRGDADHDGDASGSKPRVGEGGAALITVRERGVLAVAANGGTLSAITLGADGPVIERFRGDDEGGIEAALTGDARAIAEQGKGDLRLACAAGGRCLALGHRGRVVISRDGGATFAGFNLGPVAALSFCSDDVDAPLLVLITPPGEVWHLLEFGSDGEAERVAELPSAETPAAIAWDASREVVWIASGAGLIALGIPHRH